MKFDRVHTLGVALIVGVSMAVLTMLTVASLTVGTAGASPLTAVTAQAGAPKVGGALTEVQVDLQWANLDPALDTSAAADENLMGSIYGELFEQGPNNSIIPDLASGYKVSSDGLTVSIDIRHGVTFQDGTPFTAAAVAQNIQRVLLPANTCICDSDFTDVKSITTQGTYTVLLHLAKPDPPIIEAFIESAPNWTVSPTALAKEGVTAFGQNPVGAGPFEVVSNEASSKLVLKRYPGYWKTGQPYLDSLTFLSVADDASAYEALQAGSVQVAEGIATQAIIKSAKTAGMNVITVPSDNTTGIELNTTAAPFNNLVAREAAYYATDSPALLKALIQGNGVVTESPTGPGGDFYEPDVPGYRSYDLAKAKALVKQLGGLSVTMTAPSTSTSEVQLMEGIAAEWEAAGIQVKIDPEPLATVIQQYSTNSWQSSLAGAGGPAPDIGIQGLSAHVGCHGPLSGVCDSTLDALIAKASSEEQTSARAATFKQIFAMISAKAYEPYLYAPNVTVVTSTSVAGVVPNDASGESNVYWENVSLK
jgi:peptide/nickel transport system substrate-binding protein